MTVWWFLILCGRRGLNSFTWINQVALLLNSATDKEGDKGYREDNELKVC